VTTPIPIRIKRAQHINIIGGNFYVSEEGAGNTCTLFT
jgi:hypothetical protein